MMNGDLSHKVQILRRLSLLEAVLDLDFKAHPDCGGDPLECGDGECGEGCPLQNNRLQELGGIVMALLDEFEWHRAWAEEIEALGLVPPDTQARVQLRVERRRLQEQLRQVQSNRERLPSVQAFEDRATELEARIGVITTKLGESP